MLFRVGGEALSRRPGKAVLRSQRRVRRSGTANWRTAPGRGGRPAPREGLGVGDEQTRLPSLVSSGSEMGQCSSGTGQRLRVERRRARELLALAEMIEDALDDSGLGDEADDSHFASAARTQEGVDFVDAPNRPAVSRAEPRLGRALRSHPRRLALGHRRGRRPISGRWAPRARLRLNFLRRLRPRFLLAFSCKARYFCPSCHAESSRHRAGGDLPGRRNGHRGNRTAGASSDR